MYQRIYSSLSLISTGMGDLLRAGIPFRYVTGHPGQLSLAIPPWVGAMNTDDGFGHGEGRSSEFSVALGHISSRAE